MDAISSSQYLQHRLDLFSAGLVDNPEVACSLSERRVRLRKYVDGWNKPEISVERDCPLKGRVGTTRWYSVGQDLLARTDTRTSMISFIRVPSPPQRTAEEWTIELPVPPENYLVWSEVNLLAVVPPGTG